MSESFDSRMRREQAYLDLWFALINCVYRTPKWKWKKRRALLAELDALEKKWDRRV